MSGGERICLPTALLDAGARGVIAALWRVDDEPSVKVMMTLYRRLQLEPPSLALARTQAELRQRPAHQWAGLVTTAATAHGRPASIDHRPASCRFFSTSAEFIVTVASRIALAPARWS